MSQKYRYKPLGNRRLWVDVLIAGLLVLSSACTGGSSKAPVQASDTEGKAPPAAPAAAILKPLKVEPEIGPIGTAITVAGEGLAPGVPVELVWPTVEGSYVTRIDLGSIEFQKPAYAEKNLSLGRVNTDQQGSFKFTFTVPEDYGELHDIVAVANGQQVAKGGFYIARKVTVSPLEGPVGSPITIEVTGLGASAFQSTAGVRWDNNYVGFMSSTTTKGTARATIRAAGSVGPHTIDIGPASAAVPYLNPHQTPRKIKIPTFRFTYTITKDAGPPPATIEWPDPSRVAAVPTMPLSSRSDPAALRGVANLTPSFGPILSKPVLQATNLPADTTVDLIWMTVTGSDVTGWSGSDESLGQVAVGKDGSITAPIEIPDGLGGWHTLMVVAGDAILAEVPYYIERSLVEVTPAQVKVGETFRVHIKGVGWTELDNGVAVLYDNNFVGYACGFGSGGDVDIELVATSPGSHLIELYPMIYNRGFSQKHLWNYQVPQLTFAQDHPGLALGYRLPVFRLAVAVVE